MNITTSTLKKTVASWIRGWLPFVVVTKGGWLGFSTIQDACDYLAARDPVGGLILVGAGTYYENVVMDGNDISIMGMCLVNTKIDSTTNGHTISIEKDSCRVTNIQCQTTAGGGSAYHTINIPAGGTNFSLFDVVVQSSDGDGIYVASQDGLIQNCRVHGTDGHGINLNAAGDRCRVHGTTVLSAGGQGIYTNGSDGTFTGNLIKDPTNYSMYFDTGSANNVAAGNRFDGAPYDVGSGNLENDSLNDETTF